jgi:hypothetical protein
MSAKEFFNTLVNSAKSRFRIVYRSPSESHEDAF